MDYKLLDTNSIDAQCLEESDFEVEKEIIQVKAEMICNTGILALPIICWQSHYNKESEYFVFEAYEEQDNLLNLLTMIHLYREYPHEWYLTPAWVCMDKGHAEVASEQYIYRQLI